MKQTIADLITVGTYTTRETFNNQLFIYGSECEKYIFLAIWCVCGGGGFNDQWAYFAFQLSSHPYL